MIIGTAMIAPYLRLYPRLPAGRGVLTTDNLGGSALPHLAGRRAVFLYRMGGPSGA